MITKHPGLSLNSLRPCFESMNQNRNRQVPQVIHGLWPSISPPGFSARAHTHTRATNHVAQESPPAAAAAAAAANIQDLGKNGSAGGPSSSAAQRLTSTKHAAALSLSRRPPASLSIRRAPLSVLQYPACSAARQNPGPQQSFRDAQTHRHTSSVQRTFCVYTC